MKKLLIASALFALSALQSLRAADPVVVVSSFSNVTIDGVASGSVVDALAKPNQHANLRARLLDALLAYEAALIATHTARADAAIKSAQDGADAAVSKAQAAAAEAIKAAQDAASAAGDDAAEKIAAAQKAQADAEAKCAAETKRVGEVVAALKSISLGVPLPPVVAKAIVTEDEKRKAALLAQKAALEAELEKVQ